MTSTKIRENPFGKNVGYVRITCAYLMQRAQESGIPYWQRIEYAALANVNRSGHAPFKKGELRFTLGKLGTNGWEWAEPQTVTDAIAKAKKQGLIGADSCARCLTISPEIVSQGRGSFGCAVHDKYLVET